MPTRHSADKWNVRICPPHGTTARLWRQATIPASVPRPPCISPICWPMSVRRIPPPDRPPTSPRWTRITCAPWKWKTKSPTGAPSPNRVARIPWSARVLPDPLFARSQECRRRYAKSNTSTSVFASIPATVTPRSPVTAAASPVDNACPLTVAAPRIACTHACRPASNS
jgi:hypothetical protein